MKNGKLYVSPAPHIKRGKSVNEIMIDMIIAFIPVIIAGIYFYEKDAIRILLAAVIAAVISEGLWNKFVKKTTWLTDLSPIVSGITIGLVMPKHAPVWIIVVGSIFAIIFVKMFFGGLGQNIMNLAATTKAFLIASWSAVMATPVIEGVTKATGDIAEVVEPTASLFNQLLGQAAGNVGEVSIIAILIGGAYLAFRGVISLRAPFAFILSSFLMYAIFDKTGLLTGAFFFAAIFMATDYGTTPMTKLGQYIFGVAAGVLASFIAVKGYNPEGPYYAIIIINLFTPMIEHFTTKRVKVKEVA